jgi:hypothetical protein
MLAAGGVKWLQLSQVSAQAGGRLCYVLFVAKGDGAVLFTDLDDS